MNVEFKQLSDAIGAEILNVDISMPLEPDVFDQIRKIWLDHNIILFRGQPLKVEQQVTFSRLFGAIELHSLSEYHMKGYPEIFINSNVVVDGKPIGAQKSGHTWHSDSQFLEVPSAATILHAREAPTEGATPCTPICTGPTSHCLRQNGSRSSAFKGSTVVSIRGLLTIRIAPH